MLTYKVQAFSDQSVNLQEFCRDKNSHCIFYVKLRAAVLHDSGVGERDLFRLIIAFLNFEAPFFIDFFSLTLLLLIFLHRKNIV